MGIVAIPSPIWQCVADIPLLCLFIPGSIYFLGLRDGAFNPSSETC